MPLHNLTLQEPEATRPLTWHPSKPPCLLGQITYAMSDHPMHLCASSLYPTCSQRLLPSITARRRRSHVHTWDSTCQTLHLTFRFYSPHFLSQVCVAFTLQSLLASVPCVPSLCFLWLWLGMQTASHILLLAMHITFFLLAAAMFRFQCSRNVLQ